MEITLSPQEEKKKEDIIRFMTDYGAFANECLGYKDMNDEHWKLARFLQYDESETKLILMPRYSFKSCLVTQGFSLWKLIKNPNLRILIYSDTITKASGFLADIKNHIEGSARNSKFRDYFGEWESDPKSGKWNSTEIIIKARTEGQKEPSIDTAGIEGSKVGCHYDIIFHDDIVSDTNITTKEQMDKVFDCYRKSLSLLKPGGVVFITGTRWHFGDTYGRLIDGDVRKNRIGKFILDAEMECKDGTLLFEGIGLTREFLKEQRIIQGSAIYSAIYRNNPVDDETAIFKASDIQYYNVEAVDWQNMYKTCTVDPAGEGEDFTAITVVGTDNLNRMFLLEAVNEHLKPHQIIEHIIRLSYKWKFTRCGIETNFFRGTLEKELVGARETESKNKEFLGFGIESLKATVKDRTFNRILALEPYLQRKALYLPGDNFNSLEKVYSVLAYQIIQFTMDGAKSTHDDLLVSLALHLDIKHLGGTIEKRGPPANSPAWLEMKLYEETLKRNRFLPRNKKARFELSFN